jgi:integrase
MAASTYAETKRQIERDVLPHWRDMPLRDIKDRHVLKLINDIAAAGNGVTANRTFSRLRAFFNWSISQLRLETSPAKGLVAPVKEEARDRALSDDEIRWFWSGCEEIGWPFGPIARLLLLTAQRRDEVSKMSWSEIDLKKGVWVIPAERAKNSRAHEVHLSAGALAVLKGLPKPHRGLVFSVTGDDAVSGFSRAKDRIDAAMLRLRRRALGLPALIEQWDRVTIGRQGLNTDKMPAFFPGDGTEFGERHRGSIFGDPLHLRLRVGDGDSGSGYRTYLGTEVHDDSDAVLGAEILNLASRVE